MRVWAVLVYVALGLLSISSVITATPVGSESQEQGGLSPEVREHRVRVSEYLFGPYRRRRPPRELTVSEDEKENPGLKHVPGEPVGRKRVGRKPVPVGRKPVGRERRKRVSKKKLVSDRKDVKKRTLWMKSKKSKLNGGNQGPSPAPESEAVREGGSVSNVP